MNCKQAFGETKANCDFSVPALVSQARKLLKLLNSQLLINSYYDIQEYTSAAYLYLHETIVTKQVYGRMHNNSDVSMRYPYATSTKGEVKQLTAYD